MTTETNTETNTLTYVKVYVPGNSEPFRFMFDSDGLPVTDETARHIHKRRGYRAVAIRQTTTVTTTTETVTLYDSDEEAQS